MQRLLFILILVLFVAACLTPALNFHKFCNDPANYEATVWNGFETLGMGWLGIFVGVFAWWANPFWLMSWIMYLANQPWLARIMALVAVGLAMTTFLYFGETYPADEANVCKMTFISLNFGAYLWFASVALATVLAIVTKKQAKAVTSGNA